MLLVSHVGKRFSFNEVLRDVTFSVDDGEKIALIGPNGCGKSTLARVVAGLESPDSGSVGGDYARQSLRYLPQGAGADESDRAADLLGGDLGRLWRLGCAQRSGAELDPATALDQLEEFERSGGWQALARLDEVLRGLAVSYLEPERPVGQLSGGERTKLSLAAMLAAPGEFLLLDEPSNHLDMEALNWLQRFLAGFSGGLLLISHDRALVDAVVNGVVVIDPLKHTARRFAGGYSAYLEQSAREQERAAAAYRDQQDHIRSVDADVRRVKQRAAQFDNRSQNDFWRRRGKKVARIAKVRERKLERLLDSSEKLEKPVRTWALKPDFLPSARGGDVVVTVRDVSLDLGGRCLLNRVSLEVPHAARVVITGPNGSGKTSLLRLLTGELSPDSGEVKLGAGVVVGYLSQQQESIDPARTPLEEVRRAGALDETAARNYLHRYLFGTDDVFTRCAALSYGQRARLGLGLMVLEGVNLLLLDEPLNHLDISSRERFEEALQQFGGAIVAVSHDRYFIERIAQRVLELRDGRITELPIGALRSA